MNRCLNYPGSHLSAIVMAAKGQRRSHFLQPVQSAARCSTDVFLKSCTCKLSTCGGHTATHQPQPVQRVRSISGNDLGCDILCNLLGQAIRR